jgi:hypothetical protein
MLLPVSAEGISWNVSTRRDDLTSILKQAGFSLGRGRYQ